MTDEGRVTTRRSVLCGATAVMGSALAGCSRSVARAGPGPVVEPDRRSRPVSILAAGSLNNAVEHGLTSAVDATLQTEARGSAEAARLIAEGQKDPDIVSVADIALFDSPLDPPWYAEFATNSLVIAYDPHSAGGRTVANAGTDGWYDALLGGDVALGRTDPALDPLGYRTLFLLDLASRYYDVSNLRDRILSRKQIYPETQLISRFETGAIDAAVVYRNMAVERNYEYVGLPSQIDLSDPSHVEDWYATVSYTLPGGKTVRGDLISYGSTIRREREVVLDVFDAHTTGTYLREFGFVVPDDYPTYTGDVPDAIAN